MSRESKDNYFINHITLAGILIETIHQKYAHLEELKEHKGTKFSAGFFQIKEVTLEEYQVKDWIYRNLSGPQTDGKIRVNAFLSDIGSLHATSPAGLIREITKAIQGEGCNFPLVLATKFRDFNFKEIRPGLSSFNTHQAAEIRVAIVQLRQAITEYFRKLEQNSNSWSNKAGRYIERLLTQRAMLYGR